MAQAAPQAPAPTGSTEVGAVGSWEEEDVWMEMQRVECFERPTSETDGPWRSVGDGTVMWQQDGNVQRLLVVRGDDAELIDELACIALPDPTLAISYLAAEQIIYWRNAEMIHEVALSFASAAGCAQVWEDIQLLQEESVGPNGQMGAAMPVDARSLPEPSEESLPQLVAMFTSSMSDSHLLDLLAIDDGSCDRCDDFVAKLCQLFDRLDSKVHSVRACLAGEMPSSPAEDETERALEQLALCFKGLLCVGAADVRLLHRLLRRDTVAYMFGAFEYERAHGVLQTEHVNRHHREYLLSARRFKMPVPILNAATLECIHQNFLISYLTECILPLGLDPGTQTALAEIQQSNGRTIIEHLQSDERFLRQLLDGLTCTDPPASATAPTDLHVPAQGSHRRHAASPAPAPPRVESPREQLWGLLRELCTLASPLHPICRARFYKSLAAAGLFHALRLATAAPAAECVRSLEVLLLLLLHDPSAWRTAGLADGPHRADARALLGGLVALLVHADEGVVVQASEALRVALDASTMAAGEHNGFLDLFYGGGHCAQLVAQLEAHAAPPAEPSGGLAHVARVEAMLEAAGSTLGQHGYRSVRLAADSRLWRALRQLLQGRLRSLRATAARFVRTLVSLHPSCALLAVEHGVVHALFAQLMVGNGRRDSLLNSSILQLLQLLLTEPQLVSLREHVAQHHAAELEVLLAAGNHFVKDLLRGSTPPPSPSTIHAVRGEENRPPGSPAKQLIIPTMPPSPGRAATDGRPLAPRLAPAAFF
ncbi:hypothetical protein AB1Y20_011132 [Prymnesium parvum]|uniref:Serine/threonine-protein phosphatase 4 regulatory subunit 3-like central domain-containing protein n=1 Tax=Prymnesium parvum TaxID=97485 RepID=A0AB34INB9_PRYPA